jgi:folate-binding protein YgfZ
MDKYTICEDAVPTIIDDQFQAFLIAPGEVANLGITMPEAQAPTCWQQELAGQDLLMYRVDFLGPSTVLALVASDVVGSVCGSLAQKDIEVLPEPDFHRARVHAGFPWYGIDIDEKNLPQEADRDASAVSFSKGCYLGQETVARLDALGQVQRKLVKWSIAGKTPSQGATLDCDGKTVGRLTSIAQTNGEAREIANTQMTVALGFARRSHFEPGATAQGVDEGTGESFTGTVVGLGT